MSDYSDWLDENLGAYIRYELQLAPDVALNYAAAGLVGTVAEAEPVLADLPFAEVGDDDLREAVTGEKITPPGTDAAVADEVNDLAAYMTDEEKAAFVDLTPDQVAEALTQAQVELDGESEAPGLDGNGNGNDDASVVEVAEPASERVPDDTDKQLEEILLQLSPEELEIISSIDQDTQRDALRDVIQNK